MPDQDRRVEYFATRKPRRVPPPVDAASLLRLAREYLDRFGGPSANLRRVLERHAQRSHRDHGSDAHALSAAVENVIAQMVEAGAVDDQRFAVAKAASLADRGISRRMTVQRLREKGIGANDIDQAVAELHASGGDLAAALNLVKRRRLGYLRPEAERKLRRDKDLAVLLRGGFGFDVAKLALAGEDG